MENNNKIKQTNCKNKSRGCSYKNSDLFLLHKHEDISCKYDSTKCPGCGDKYLGSKWIDHFSLTHGINHAFEYDTTARVCLIYNEWNKFQRYAIKAHQKLFIFWFLFDQDVVSMSLIVDVDDSGFKYFKCEYKIFISGVDKCAIGNLLPENNLSNYKSSRDWRKDIYVPHSHIKKFYDDNSYDYVNVEICITKIPNL